MNLYLCYILEPDVTAGLYRIAIEQGTTFKRTFTSKNPDGSAINLTGYTPKMQIRTAGGKLLLDVTIHLTLTPLAGRVELDLPDTVTATMDFDTAKYDRKLKGTTTTRLIEGLVRISHEVTE